MSGGGYFLKGMMLALATMLVAPVLSFAGDFAVTNSFSPDSGTVVLRSTPRAIASAGQFITDAQTETRGSRPIVAYTLFNFETKVAQVSVQPVFGRINGAQVQLNW
jgi:hypothetical protein